MKQPKGFEVGSKKNCVYKWNKSLNGLNNLEDNGISALMISLQVLVLNVSSLTLVSISSF